jgi:hypothetical protein
MSNLLIYATAIMFGIVATPHAERLIKKYKDTKDEYKKMWSE